MGVAASPIFEAGFLGQGTSGWLIVLNKSSEDAKKPIVNLMVIGGKKCGTTLFAEQLSMHPSFFVAPQKELSYFCSEKKLTRGINWYHSNFIGRLNEPFVVDASVDYLGLANKTVREIYNYNPNCKLICLVRDPINRAYSQIRWHLQLSGSDHDIQTYVDQAIFESRYTELLSIYRKYFSDIILVDFDIFVSDQNGCIARLGSLLGLPENISNKIRLKNRHLGSTINPRFRWLEKGRQAIFSYVKRRELYYFLRLAKRLGLSNLYRRINNKPANELSEDIKVKIISSLSDERQAYLAFKNECKAKGGIGCASDLL